MWGFSSKISVRSQRVGRAGGKQSKTKSDFLAEEKVFIIMQKEM